MFSLPRLGQNGSTNGSFKWTDAHWGRVSHICVSNLTITGSDNGLSPGRRQAIIWTNAGILLIRNLGTNFNEILSKIHIFSFKKMHLKTSSAKWRPFCLGFNVLTQCVCHVESVNWIIIGSGYGLPHVRGQIITRTNTQRYFVPLTARSL